MAELLRRESAGLTPSDAALARHLVEAVARDLRMLDHWLDHLCHKRPELSLCWLIRLGLAQVFFSREPDHAIVNETVELAPPRARGFVNAVLRRALREKTSHETLAAAAAHAVRYNLPDELWERWAGRWGGEWAGELATWMRRPAEARLVVNTFHPDHGRVAEDPRIHPMPGHTGFFLRDGVVPREWFEEGLVYAQDPGAALACRMLDPKPGERILDACAAPGGKSRMLAELSGGKASLLCTDSSPARLRLLESNLRRLRVPGIQTRRADWAHPRPPGESFDAALVDAPCSNTGVLRRRLEARRFLSAADFGRHAGLQLRLLRNVAAHIHPGGRVVYSTCSLEPEENEQVVAAFLDACPGWSLVRSAATLPHRDDCDGHYAALLAAPAAV